MSQMQCSRARLLMNCDIAAHGPDDLSLRSVSCIVNQCSCQNVNNQWPCCHAVISFVRALCKHETASSSDLALSSSDMSSIQILGKAEYVCRDAELYA